MVVTRTLADAGMSAVATRTAELPEVRHSARL